MRDRRERVHFLGAVEGQAGSPVDCQGQAHREFGVAFLSEICVLTAMLSKCMLNIPRALKAVAKTVVSKRKFLVGYRWQPDPNSLFVSPR